jgi:D-3-phosphoglycerate dehydrogenase / 2-oxoglutarate reductase
LINEKLLSYPRNKIKILLLDKIHRDAYLKLNEHGFNVEDANCSLNEQQLAERIGDFHILGIRSSSKITLEHLKKADKLMAIGCFGVGTNQVDLPTARSLGIPVFNAPYGNTRSVAELGICFILSLARKIGDRNREMHQAIWSKSAKACYEVRGKTVGIIGYGHIGQQLGILAESIGMEVVFYDKMPRLPLGRARSLSSIEELFHTADFTTLHVPELPSKKPLITKEELKLFKKGSFILNLSRGSLIDLEALAEFIKSGHIGGAALDVFPSEPKSAEEKFTCPLLGVDNVILTPHVGGSTEEAQEKIGIEVADKFIKFIDNGTTTGSVNFPNIDLPSFPNSHRILNIHRNQPGVLNQINQILSKSRANIDSQFLGTQEDVGYLIVDLSSKVSEEIKRELDEQEYNIRTRVLF